MLRRDISRRFCYYYYYYYPRFYLSTFELNDFDLVCRIIFTRVGEIRGSSW